MSSVTRRIAQIQQPKGGYLRSSLFSEICYNDGKTLGDDNIHATIIGLAVDYLTRFMMGASKDEAFRISIRGYEIKTASSEKAINKDKKKRIDIDSLLMTIKGLDENSIKAACKAVTYDVWLRNIMGAIMAKGAEETNPSKETINNIRIMVERSLSFWENYGPILYEGFTFEPFGYTATVSSGDADYLTADTLWDFKVSKAKPSSKHTLQLLMYWIMGQHSGRPEFEDIKKIGFFNPRLNTVYLLETDKIPDETIAIVEKDIICYD